MPIASVNGVDIYYETFGDEVNPPLLLVCGLGMQMVTWSQEWFDAVLARGFHVIAFDNRDSGLSTHLTESGVPDLMALLEGQDANITYLLGDMADDAVALLDTLGVESAHIVGISMGGMIVQQIAISHPHKVRSLCSIMATTGDPTVGHPSQEAAEALLTMHVATRDEAIEAAVKTFGIIGSPGFKPDTDRLREMAAVAYDRNHEPTGIARQMGAILASPDRTEGLRTVTVPTLVIHGTDDPLVAPSGGQATAKAVASAKLMMIEGMGHDLPPDVWDEMLDAIVANTREAGAAQADTFVTSAP